MAKLKILLVDDELDFLKLMGVRIEKMGYDLIEASSGKEALETIKDKKPDIVILDYKMPEMDGVATLKEIRKTDKKLPVIMFTAYPEPKPFEEVEKLGISFFIPKLSIYTDVTPSLKAAIEIIEKQLEKLA